MTPPRVLALATLGHGSSDEKRLIALLREFGPEVFPFDRAHKFRSLRHLWGTIRRTRPDIVVMEGTGLFGGVVLVLARVLLSQKYVVSSGDAVGPFIGSRFRILGPVFGLYERLLCRCATGFIGWTPYLVGRALTFGTPRAVTAAGWAPFTRTPDEQTTDRVKTREKLGIPPGNIVVGIAGSMVWTRRYGYCYGAELVEAAHRVTRPDITFLVVGDGSGKPRLESRAQGLPPGRLIFTGRVPQDELPALYAAMDIGSLPQSVDRVGSFRYTTKVSEYAAFRLPVVTGQIPLAYDLGTNWMWRLPGTGPWTPAYLAAFAELLNALTPEQLAAKRTAIPTTLPEFDYTHQARRVGELIRDITKL